MKSYQSACVYFSSQKPKTDSLQQHFLRIDAWLLDIFLFLLYWPDSGLYTHVYTLQLNDIKMIFDIDLWLYTQKIQAPIMEAADTRVYSHTQTWI